MKDVKTTRLEVRVTPEEKEHIKQCAQNYNLKMSELIRLAIDKFINEKER